jgi:hypothetical protein
MEIELADSCEKLIIESLIFKVKRLEEKPRKIVSRVGILVNRIEELASLSLWEIGSI